ncbi:hypothetical protein FA95DRAFT_1517591 [Auriscalpium vulgare]|uniref:Uncharacterized protein n=1 Tax=Auriscalpium vulgare TaxID=40419 RepID=A0ACB8RVS5_9AGAM|nr:hypothetical protein FA95DRAFT_1517591 [Auriscalpium vulgare]
MANNYIFSLQPTFTQGLIIGQVSILALLAVILKYLFLDTSPDRLHEQPAYRPRAERDVSAPDTPSAEVHDASSKIPESTEWFNILVQQVAEAYRSKLRNDTQGIEGDEILRRRIEEFANNARPQNLLDPIQVHAVDIGTSAPRLSNAKMTPVSADEHGRESEIEFDLVYTDTVSVSLSTAYLFNYPMFAFARLPVSVTISLSIFSCSILVKPPSPSSPAPALTVSIPPSFTLDLKTTSLLGSRAKLADVPKLHELIEHQLRRALIQRGTWKVVLPGLSNVAEVKEEAQKEFAESLS